ncbi:MAG: hypothetical protein NT074_03680 [Methanomicrobiales archaeon]|nr:hypothetical protein [Methanomicrobiales archaeon]
MIPHNETIQHLISGEKISAFAFRVGLERDGCSVDRMVIPGTAHLPLRDKIENQLADIITKNLISIPENYKHALMTVVHLLPDEFLPISMVEFYALLSMGENGGAWWEVVAVVDSIVGSLPIIQTTVEKTRAEVLEAVCAI